MDSSPNSCLHSVSTLERIRRAGTTRRRARTTATSPLSSTNAVSQASSSPTGGSRSADTSSGAADACDCPEAPAVSSPQQGKPPGSKPLFSKNSPYIDQHVTGDSCCGCTPRGARCGCDTHAADFRAHRLERMAVATHVIGRATLTPLNPHSAGHDCMPPANGDKHRRQVQIYMCALR